MRFPWSKRSLSKGTTNAPVLPFKDSVAMFEFQCEYGETEIVKGRAIFAIVLDARRFSENIKESVKIEDDGSQLAIIRVASKDGGFIVPAKAPTTEPGTLKPFDAVMWVPK